MPDCETQTPVPSRSMVTDTDVSFVLRSTWPTRLPAEQQTRAARRSAGLAPGQARAAGAWRRVQGRAQSGGGAEVCILGERPAASWGKRCPTAATQPEASRNTALDGSHSGRVTEALGPEKQPSQRPWRPFQRCVGSMRCI